MILVPEDDISKKSALGATSAGTPAHDPPPSYTPVDSEIASGSTTSQVSIPPDIKPSNFVGVSRQNGSVKGTWLIDPTVSIPPQFLAPLAQGETEQTRKNVLLESKNGCIDVDIFVMPVAHDDLSTMNGRKRVSIYTGSHNGTVTTRIHDIIPPTNAGEIRLPLQISSISTNGAIYVYLPRSFRGPLRLKTHNGSIRFSDGVQAVGLTTFSEVDKVQRSFLGHFDASEWEIGAEWVGDELFAESHNGVIKVYFDDEGNMPGKPKLPGFFERLFRF